MEEELYGSLAVDWNGKKWIQLAKRGDSYSYVSIGINKPEFKIGSSYIRREEEINLNRIPQYKTHLNKTGKDALDLTESCKRIYEELQEKKIEYTGFDRSPEHIFAIGVGTFLGSAGAYHTSKAFQASTDFPSVGYSLISVGYSLIAGLFLGVGSIVLYRSLKETGLLSKGARKTKRELEKMVKAKGINYKRIISYDNRYDELRLKI